MRLTHLIGVVGGVALLSATGFAAQQAGQRDQVLTGYKIVPAQVAATATNPAPAVPDVPTTSRARSRADAAVDPRWARRTAEAAGIPLPAMTAYARASVLAPRQCRIGWTTLAGIGWVESQHGTIGDRQLGDDGYSSEPILGPALDGGLYAAVPATRDSARWHGDRQWDHAIGPMQFIPSTWRTWQADGDGDGVADPNDIDDASLAAADYLCQSGDLMSSGTWSRSILSYNHSTDYVLNVYTAADTYSDRTG
ncbi:MAG: lytic transglycosylase domain-containing protein [Nocardioides sp.]|uniref:lytic transglycosylase domain-containing protein n=1 Tax=Nocardioides sp. TaxID=35761 RepID=UPI003267D8C3